MAYSYAGTRADLRISNAVLGSRYSVLGPTPRIHLSRISIFCSQSAVTDEGLPTVDFYLTGLTVLMIRAATL